MDNKTFYIYCLVNPIDNTIFYVGRTGRSLDIRLNGHVSAIKKNKNKALSLILSVILSKGFRPVIKLIEETTRMQRELELINEYSLIHPLVNIVKEGYRTPGSGRKYSGIKWSTVSFRITAEWEDTIRAAVKKEIARLKTLEQ